MEPAAPGEPASPAAATPMGAPGRTGWAATPRPSLPAPAQEQAANEDAAQRSAAAIHEALREQLARKLPELSLTDDELHELGESMARVRAASERLGRLEHTADHAQARRHHQAVLMAELGAMAELTGMGAAELTDALSDDGLTTAESDPEDIVHEPLPPPR